MSAMIYFAVWLYDEAHGSTRAFWKVSCDAASQHRLEATIDAMNALIATQDCDLNLQEWEEARKTTAEAIRDNDLHEFYPGARRGDDVSDATMIDYWNYLNDEIYHDSWGRVPHGGAVTLDEFIERLSVYRPRPVLRVVP